MAKTSSSTAAASPRHGARAGEGRHGKTIALPPVRPGYYRSETYRVDESVGFLMRRIVDLVSKAIDARMAQYGLTDAQWRPLLKLSLASDATPSHLARSVGCDTGATTRMIDRLEDKGLLRRVRSTNDRRVQQLELTDEGKKTAAVVPNVIADVLNAHLVDLSRAEVDQLRDMLQRILETARTEAATAGQEGGKKS